MSRIASCQTILVVFLAIGMRASAQLAITEVMSEAVTTSSFKGPDFWELTNFGTNQIDLDGYEFCDGNNTCTNIQALTIRPRESIVFVRREEDSTITNRELFMQWWGPSRFGTNFQIYFYPVPGLNHIRDEIILTDASGEVVDHVILGVAQHGFSFTYDRITGQFGVPSVEGQGGAWRAATSEDVGSPGIATSAIPVAIRRHPENRNFNGCGTTVLEVDAVGMPRPKFQWFTNGIEVPNGAGNPLLLQVSAPAEFTARVRVYNGVSEVLSSNAIITVTTNPTAPVVTERPQDLSAFTAQRVRFTARAEGYPCVQYQWLRDGVELPGEASEVLEFNADATPGESIYTVRLSNDFGSTNLAGRLVITPWPTLKITEVMASPYRDTNFPSQDWFELTNCGTNSVQLLGCRISDNAASSGGFSITNPVSVAPGESIIFVENVSAEVFNDWWGSTNLLPCLQVVTFVGFGLSATGDGIFIWNPAALNPNDYFTSASFARSSNGITLEVTSECSEEFHGCFGYEARLSVVGERGAFLAARGYDVGSPGYSEEIPQGTFRCPPKLLSIRREGAGISISCRVSQGRSYQLLTKQTLDDPVWLDGPVQMANTPVITFVEPFQPGTAARFFAVREQ